MATWNKLQSSPWFLLLRWRRSRWAWSSRRCWVPPTFRGRSCCGCWGESSSRRLPDFPAANWPAYRTFWSREHFKWLCNSNLSLKCDKPVSILFGSRKMLNKCSNLSLQVNGKHIRHVQSMNYHGMLLYPSLKWNLHTDNVYTAQQISTFNILFAPYN